MNTFGKENEHISYTQLFIKYLFKSCTTGKITLPSVECTERTPNIPQYI